MEAEEYKGIVNEVVQAIRAVARIAKSAAEARELLAHKLSEKAKEGAFDDVVKKATEADAQVKDFIDNG